MGNNGDELKPSFLVHFLAGGIAGTVGASVTCPLEVVKTRLQSSLYKSAPISYSFKVNPVKALLGHLGGVMDLLIQIKRREGITALWKGLGPNLVGVVPARAIYFSVYSQGKHIYTTINNGKENSFIHMLSAASAGFSVACVTNPIWLIKTRIQLQQEGGAVEPGAVRYKNALHCAYIVFKTEGIRGLYRGFSASVIGLSESSLQFVTYEYLKKTRLEQVNKSLRISEKEEINKLGTADTLGIAAVAKLFAAILTYPHEVVRTRLRQTPVNGKLKYTGLIQTGKLIYKEEGLAALYGGMTAHLMRVVPNAAILFFMYELVVRIAS